MHLALLWILVMLPSLFISSSTEARAELEPVTPYLNPPFPVKLSAWKLWIKHDGLWDLNTGVLPYEVVNPLFSDYALKFRSLWLPEGEQIVYQPDHTLQFPVGAILSKTFAYPRQKLRIHKPTGYHPGSTQGERFAASLQALTGLYRLETRLLIKRPDGWLGLPYVWDADQQDATLQLIGASFQLTLEHSEFGTKTFPYQVPNANQCKGCHVRQDGFKKIMLPLGPHAARNLNRSYPYPSGSANQLQTWQELGLLRALPHLAEIPRIAAWDQATESLERRARAYLDSNCAHCHQASGPASTSGLFLNWEENDLAALGFCKTAVAAGNAGGGRQYDIVPGSPEASLLHYRLASEDPAVMMPELGRSLRHEAGVALIEQWISSLRGSCRAGSALGG